LSLFKTEKKQLVKSNLILKIEVYHDQEGDKGSFSEVSTWTHKSPLTKEKTSNQHLFKRHYIYRYWFWWTLHFGPAETKTKLEQKINAEKISYC
jgi:dTDP-D-glucose 4,6-dehydratase